MKLDELRTIVRNKIMVLEQQRHSAVASGDLEAVMRIDADLAETRATADAIGA